MLMVLACSLTKAHSEMKKIEKEIAPGKAHEECMKLEPPQKLQYAFDCKSPVDFNVHYHLGKEVFLPVKKDQSMREKGEFAPTSRQDFCMMWRNKTGEAVTVRYQFAIK